MDDALTTANIGTQPGIQAEAAPPLSRAQKTLRALGWTGLGVFLLVLFTLMKLPEIRLKNYIQGTLSNSLASQGMSFSAKSASLSILFGVSYTMKDVTITPRPPELPIKIDELELSPAFLPLLTGKLGGNLELKQGDGELKASFAFRGGEGSVSFSGKQLNLGRLGVLAAYAKVKGGATVDGAGSVAGDFSVPSTWNGLLKLKLSKVNLDAQSIQGIALPAIGIGDGNIDISIGGGKAAIKDFKLGKAADDLMATVTGDVALGPNMDASALNLKSRFKFSPKVAQALPALDMILSQGKQADGFYAFNISGSISSPMPSPAGPGT